MTDVVTFADFARLARVRGWTPEYLAEGFRGTIEEPGEFFHRVLKGKPSWDVAIPYRSVLELYREEMSPKVPLALGARLCLCGCGEPVAGRKQFFSSTCKKRAYRNKRSSSGKVADHQKGVCVSV